MEPIKEDYYIYSRTNSSFDQPLPATTYKRWNSICLSVLQYVWVGSNILGSTVNHHSAELPSNICEYWPTHGNRITAFSASSMSIGQVMSYFGHKITVINRATNTSSIHYYIMAKVQWMCDHHQSSRYGISAVVCSNSFREQSQIR